MFFHLSSVSTKSMKEVFDLKLEEIFLIGNKVCVMSAWTSLKRVREKKTSFMLIEDTELRLKNT